MNAIKSIVNLFRPQAEAEPSFEELKMSDPLLVTVEAHNGRELAVEEWPDGGVILSIDVGEYDRRFHFENQGDAFYTQASLAFVMGDNFIGEVDLVSNFST